MTQFPENAISIRQLSKSYKLSSQEIKEKQKPKMALNSIDLDIPRGSLFALLGPNGAGKSTLINILAGLVIKTTGQVKIWDIDLDVDSRNARAAIGIVPQELNIDPYFTPWQLLEIQAGLFGVPIKERKTAEILDMMGLYDKRFAYARTLSGGMRRRLLVGKAMVHEPPILVLDEPTAGVDVELRRQLWDSVVKLNEQGVTILLTTHYLEEAEELCDRIAIINKGDLIINDRKSELLKRLDSKIVRITLDKKITDIPENLKAFNPQLNIDDDGRVQLDISFAPSRTLAGEIIAMVQKNDLTIRDVSTIESDLEDIFIQLTKD